MHPFDLSSSIFANNIVSDALLMFRSALMGESQYIQETHQVRLDFCEKNYSDFDVLEKNGRMRSVLI